MKIHGTAKGGAIGKKDFGVAFGGAAAGLTVCQETVNDYKAMPNGGEVNYGIKATSGYGMIGETVASVTFALLKYSAGYTMSGTLSAYIGVSGDYTTIGTQPATILTAAPGPVITDNWQEIKFSGSGTRVLAENDYIWVSHPSGGAGNLIAIATNTGGAQSGTNGYWRGSNYPPTGQQFASEGMKQCVSTEA